MILTRNETERVFMLWFAIFFTYASIVLFEEVVRLFVSVFDLSSH